MRMEKNIKWIGIGVSIILFFVLGYLVVENQRETNAKKAVEAELEKQTIPYLKEITDIQNDLVLKKEELEKQEIGSLASIAFVVSSEKEAKNVKTITANLKVPISIVLNDTMDVETAKEVVRTLDTNRFDYILTGNTIEKTGWNKVEQMQSLLAKLGDQEQPGFLLLNKEDTEQNLEALQDRGYTTILRYRKEVDSGITEWNQYFFPYSIIKESGVTETRLSKIEKKSANMFFVYHMGAVSEGMLSETDLEEEIKLLQTAEEQGKIRMIGLYELQETFLKQSETKSDLEQEYAEYEAEQKERIAELERAIDEIYAE